jgi:hypothetical protein
MHIFWKPEDLMEEVVDEKRKLERFSLQLLSRLSVKSGDRGQDSIELLTRNISSGGAFIQTSRPFKVGTRLDIEVIFPLDRIKKVEGEMACMKVNGSVIRSDTEGMAISFDKDYQILPLHH